MRRDIQKSIAWQRRSKRLRPISKKRLARNKEWLARKRELFNRDTHCRFEGCRERNLDAHHLLSTGGGGTDELSNLVGLCREHHDYVHLHRPEAERLGLLRPRSRLESP